MIRRGSVTKGDVPFIFLIPMIPNWVSKRRDPEPPERYFEPIYVDPPAKEFESSKECAICRRGNADYEHKCGVAFHKSCIQQYFDALSSVDGAERICPHCYEEMPLDLDADAAVEVAPLLEEVYNQYLELSDEFSIALIDGQIRDVSVFLNSPENEEYFVSVDFGMYPKKPTFSFPDDLLANLDGLPQLLEILNNWDPKFPPRIVDVLLDIQSHIRIREEPAKDEDLFEEPKDAIKEDEKQAILESEGPVEVVEVEPEEDIVEVEPESSQNGSPYIPFFQLEPFSGTDFSQDKVPSDSFENEAAISQYLELSNSFSVELIDDEVYNVIVHLSSLDGGIYNIYPITINFKNYPKKPQMTFTDDLLVRIRGLPDIMTELRSWELNEPRMIADILKEFESKLMEDSLLENELEALKREYPTKRITKNRIVVTLTSYGYKTFDVELDLSEYPRYPLIYLSQELSEIKLEELEGLKMWDERPQKRIKDVLRSLSSAINNLFRLEFEELLLRMVAEEFDVVNNEFHLGMDIPILREENTEEEQTPRGHLHMRIRVPDTYPLSPPKIEIDSDSEELKRDAQVFLIYMLKSWSPSMFLADALNRLSLSLSNTSLYKCMICGGRECPTCGLPLLTVPVSEAQDICEVPCIHCKRPYHIHCVADAMERDMVKCGFCLSDISRFFRKPSGDLV